MRPYKKRVYRKRAPKRAKKLYRKSTVGLAVKSYVKRAIHANIENKRQSYNQIYAVGSYANSNTLYARPITPYTGYMVINQGLGQADRTGNRLKVVKAMLRYVAFPLSYDPGANPTPIPQEFQIILGYPKQTSGTIPSNAVIQQLFQVGNTSQPPQGDLGDLITPFNKDVWTIKKYIRHKIGNSAVEGTGSSTNSAYYANNDFKFNVVRSLDITSIYPKNINFNDAGVTHQGAGLYIMVQAINANGTTKSAAIQSLSFEFTVDLTYEDA